ncbi:hypothetical protein BH20ACT21_BH20ACT21_05520 [soil metagenome]
MRLGMLLLIAVIILSSLVAAAAGGGGWWSYIDLEGQHLGIGETLTVRSEVWFRGVVDAQKASNSDYYAYLVRGIDREALRWAMSRPQPKRWWKPPAEMTLLGDVDLSQWDTNSARSTARLTIPELSLGRYHLMLCDRGCRNPLGNLIPARVEVVDDPLAAQTSRKLQDATDRTSLALARLRKDLRQSDSRVYLGAAEQLRKLGGVKANASETAQAVTALRKRLESLTPIHVRCRGRPTLPGSWADWELRPLPRGVVDGPHSRLPRLASSVNRMTLASSRPAGAASSNEPSAACAALRRERSRKRCAALQRSWTRVEERRVR